MSVCSIGSHSAATGLSVYLIFSMTLQFYNSFFIFFYPLGLVFGRIQSPQLAFLMT
jgi:hypothetical protein